jgi:hypothetical protein
MKKHKEKKKNKLMRPKSLPAFTPLVVSLGGGSALSLKPNPFSLPDLEN